MNIWKNKLVPFLWAFAGAMFLVPTLKQIVKEEPLDYGPLFMACMFFTFAFFYFTVIFGVAGNRANARKQEKASEE